MSDGGDGGNGEQSAGVPVSAALEPDREQRHGEDELDDQRQIAQLLQRLIESGQVRVLASDAAGSDSLDDDDDDDDDGQDDEALLPTDDDDSDCCAADCSMGRASSKATNWVEKDAPQAYDLQSDIRLKSGLALPRTNSANVQCRVRQRELGACRVGRPQAFTMAERAALGNLFLPNRKKVIDRPRTKTFCCEYVNDGRRLLTASQDQEIRFYERRGSKQRYKPCRQIKAPNVGWSILDLAVSPDGRHLIYSTWADFVHQCNISEEEADWEAFDLQPPDYRFCIFSLRFSKNGEDILAGASDRRLYVYNRERRQLMLRICAHEDDVNAVCFGDDTSNIIYSGADDGLCKVWDRRTLSEEAYPTPVGVFAGHLDGITHIDSRGDGRYLITNSKDQLIKLWDVRKFSNESALKETREAVSKQQWDYRWQSVPRNAKNWRRLEGDTSVQSYRGHTVLHTLIRAYFSPAFTTGQRFIYTGDARGSCYIYDVLTGKRVTSLGKHRACVRDVAWHPYENEICTSSWDGMTAAWRYDGRARRRTHPENDSDDEDTSDEDGKKLGATARGGAKRRAAVNTPDRSRSRRGRWFLQVSQHQRQARVRHTSDSDVD